MTLTFTAFTRDSDLDLADDIATCVKVVKSRKIIPTAIHLHPTVEAGQAIDGLPVIPDKYIPPTEIWIGWEKGE
jgi:hypothetical protein